NFATETCNLFCNRREFVLLWIKTVTEQIPHATIPLCAHLHTRKYWQLLFRRQCLNLVHFINPIVVSHSYQIILFCHQIINQCLCRPETIAIGSMHMEINRCISSQGYTHLYTLQDSLLIE